jgi:hypothetical protein
MLNDQYQPTMCQVTIDMSDDKLSLYNFHQISNCVIDDDIPDETNHKSESAESISSITKYMNETYAIWSDIKNNNTGNNYLIEYNQPSSYFLSSNDACQKLFTFNRGYYGHLIKLIYDNQLPILIGGSSNLAAVMKEESWFPNDIDIYMKNISYENIISLDNCIKKSCSFFSYEYPKILLVRKSITLTWIIFSEHLQIIAVIQLNLLNINSWAENFSCYHSDLVCLGYDILNKNFICLGKRWLRFVDNYHHNLNHDKINPIYFCNFLNFDTPKTLNRSWQKYYKRGFYTKGIYCSKQDCFVKINISLSDSISTLELLDFLEKICFTDNFAISNQINDLVLQNEDPPSILNVKDIYKSYTEFCYLPITQFRQTMINTKLSDLITGFYNKNYPNDELFKYKLSSYYRGCVLITSLIEFFDYNYTYTSNSDFLKLLEKWKKKKKITTIWILNQQFPSNPMDIIINYCLPDYIRKSYYRSWTSEWMIENLISSFNL